MPKKNKSTYAEFDRRVNKIYELLICGFTYYDILRYASEKTDWDVTDRQVDHYIAGAKELIKENARETQEQFLEKSKTRFEDLYKKAMSEKNLTECRQIILTANKVLGYEMINVHQTFEITNETKDFLNKIYDRATKKTD